MKAVETNIIEKIIQLSEKLKKYGDANFFQKKGITVQQFNILGVIVEEGSITINKLKRKLIISSASLSQTIARMENAGLVVRSLGDEDKREIILNTTKEGESLYNELHTIYLSNAVEKFKKFSTTEKQDIYNKISLLDDLVD